MKYLGNALSEMEKRYYESIAPDGANCIIKGIAKQGKRPDGRPRYIPVIRYYMNDDYICVVPYEKK